MRAIQFPWKEGEEEERRTLRLLSPYRSALSEVSFGSTERGKETKGKQKKPDLRKAYFLPLVSIGPRVKNMPDEGQAFFCIYGDIYRMALYDLDCLIFDMVTCGIPVAVWLVPNKM